MIPAFSLFGLIIYYRVILCWRKPAGIYHHFLITHFTKFVFRMLLDMTRRSYFLTFAVSCVALCSRLWILRRHILALLVPFREHINMYSFLFSCFHFKRMFHRENKDLPKEVPDPAIGILLIITFLRTPYF